MGYVPIEVSECLQNNFEFSSRIRFGAYGERLDDLNIPGFFDVLVVGDSHAMGWGVSGGDIFTAKLKKAGINVLNLSVSSYGTARELHRLQEFSLAEPSIFEQVSTLIIQYSDNDLSENKAYLTDPWAIVGQPSPSYLHALGAVNPRHLGYRALPSMPDSADVVNSFYRVNSVVKVYSSFADNFYRLLRGRFDLFWLEVREQWRDYDNKLSGHAGKHSDYFFRVLSKNRSLLEGKNIIIYISNAHGWSNSEYSEEFAARAERFANQHGLFMVVLDSKKAGLAGESGAYYLIDDHMNSAGHKRLADALLELL